MEFFCYICFDLADAEMMCDRCGHHYCYDCSYTYGLHYQYEGNLCHWCSDQRRRTDLDINQIRDNKLKLILNFQKTLNINKK